MNDRHGDRTLQRTGAASGLGKGVHDYYAHYTNNADAKIGALFAFNAAIAALLFSNVPDDWAARLFLILAVGMQVVAAGWLLNGIYPRLTTAGASPLFWEDVKERESADAYADEIAALTPDEAERAYARNNYAVAHILHRKFASVRNALRATAVGVAFALVSAGLGY